MASSSSKILPASRSTSSHTMHPRSAHGTLATKLGTTGDEVGTLSMRAFDTFPDRAANRCAQCIGCMGINRRISLMTTRCVADFLYGKNQCVRFLLSIAVPEALTIGRAKEQTPPHQSQSQPQPLDLLNVLTISKNCNPRTINCRQRLHTI